MSRKPMGGRADERMARRTFLSALALSAYPLFRSSAQDSSAAPLRVPGVVQERSRTVSGDNDLLVQELEKRLKCTCGCNLDVFTCRTTDFTCTTSPAMHRDVLQRLEAGSTPDEVVEQFVARYGESILMQPPRRGFNWTAYLTPFAALAVGAGTVALFMRRWMAARPDQPIGGSADGEAKSSADPPVRLSAEDQELLRRELERLES